MTLATGAMTAAPSVAPLPTGIPARIYPADQGPSTAPSGFTLISILFNQSLNWQFEATNPDSSNQIFAYFPGVIANALGINLSQVLTLYLQAYVPATYKSAADVAQLGTMYLAYIPTADVNTLAAEIKVQSSQFYTGSQGIGQQLAQRVDPAFAINSVVNPNTNSDGNGSNPNGASGSASSSAKTRQDAIIGVVSALGAIAVLILGFLIYRSWQRRQELAHRRLSDPDPTAIGARPQGQEFDRDSLGGQRRRSFYYAEDSLSGGQGGADDRYDYHSSPENGMRERRPIVPGAIVPGAISSPYLQQSSMNW